MKIANFIVTIFLGLSLGAIMGGMYVQSNPNNSLEFTYNGSTIELPNEIDCFGTGDTLVVYKDEKLNGGRKIYIGGVRTFSKENFQAICNEINAEAKDSTDYEIYKAVVTVLERKGINDDLTLQQFLKTYNL